jgi:transposase
MGKKRYRAYDATARVELPGDLRQYLPRDHAVFLLEDLVEALDLTPITSEYERGDGRGQPPYHPRFMTKLLLHAYCEGETSSREIMRKTYEDIGYRVLCVGQHPDFRTISDFRERHLPAFGVLLKETVRLAKELGQVRLEHVAQDGTKVLANASKHKAMTDERMGQTDERLGREIAEILEQARQRDAAEDVRYGRAGTGDELAAAEQREVDFRQTRRRRIQAARAALEARAAAEAAAQAPAAPQRPSVRVVAPELPHEEGPEPTSGAAAAAPSSSRPQLTLVATPPTPGSVDVDQAREPPAVAPAPTEQYSFTDDASRIMPSKDGFVQAYNAQAAVDSYRQIIVACEVTDAPTDIRQLQPLLDQVRQMTGCLPGEYSADSGYWSAENVTTLEQRGVDAYIPPRRPPRRRDGSPSESLPTPLVERMQAKLTTPAGKRTYSLRMETAEPVFGQMKDGRGLRRFRMRGLAKVRGEWALWCATHNLLKLARVRRAQPVAAGAALAASA